MADLKITKASGAKIDEIREIASGMTVLEEDRFFRVHVPEGKDIFPIRSSLEKQYGFLHVSLH